jgi:hypothetical protein
MKNNVNPEKARDRIINSTEPKIINPTGSAEKLSTPQVPLKNNQF